MADGCFPVILMHFISQVLQSPSSCLRSLVPRGVILSAVGHMQRLQFETSNFRTQKIIHAVLQNWNYDLQVVTFIV